MSYNHELSAEIRLAEPRSVQGKTNVMPAQMETTMENRRVRANLDRCWTCEFFDDCKKKYCQKDGKYIDSEQR